jgi:GNAT superfamily N-acetyltransferase
MWRRVPWGGWLDQTYLDCLNVEGEGRHLRTYLAPRDAGWRILVSEEQGRVLGFVSFVASRETTVGHLGALFVSPDRFGLGIGTRLLDAATAALRQGGCTEAILWTLEDDGRLIGFYEHRGWKPDGGRQTIELDRPRPVVRCRKRLVAHGW